MCQDGQHLLVAEPYLPGIWNDEMIFKDGLANFLEPAERVEADGGYRGSAPELVKCPGVAEVIPNYVAMQQRVRSRQEAVNNRFKIGRYCQPHIATNYLNTKLFLVPS